jgi:hypothetical protein
MWFMPQTTHLIPLNGEDNLLLGIAFDELYHITLSGKG